MGRNESIDLHVHSTYSDGRLSPRDLADLAAQRNVTALAITDHDSLAGWQEKIDACRDRDIEPVVGIEMSCELDGREAHILSLFADPEADCVARIAELSSSRRERMLAMLGRLETMGIHIGLDDLPVDDDGVYGRPHLARAMVAKGIVKNVSEAFARYLYDAGPVHIAKTRLTAEEGIALAKEMRGVAVLAHPGVSGLIGEIDRLAAAGLDGVEVYHPKHGGETIATLLRQCRDRGLVVSGGSDFHSPGDGPEIGAARVPVDVLEPLRLRAGNR